MAALPLFQLLLITTTLTSVSSDSEGFTDIRVTQSPENRPLQEEALIEFGRFIEKVAAPVPANDSRATQPPETRPLRVGAFLAFDKFIDKVAAPVPANESHTTQPPETHPLREGAMIEIGRFIDKVAAPPHGNESDCNSERLRAVLEQSISENTTLAIERILKRIDDGQFVANCTFKGAPELDRRENYCQLTRGSTTCALSTGRRPDPPGIELHVPEFNPRPAVIAVPGEGGEMSHLVLTFNSHHGPVPAVPLSKSRGDGSARRLIREQERP